MADAGQFYSQLPKFSKYWLTASVVMSLIGRFDILSLFQLALTREDVIQKWELWRCITSLFTYPLLGSRGFNFLINCYFIIQYSVRLEKDQFGRNPADYLFLQLIVATLAIVLGLLFNIHFLMDALVVAITYIWCQLNKEVIVNFWFGTRFKAVYLPWVLAAMELIFSASLASLIGVFIGHFYYFLKFQYPQELGGTAFLETPLILKRFAPDVSGGMGYFGVAPASRAEQRNDGAANPASVWGRGNTLGR